MGKNDLRNVLVFTAAVGGIIGTGVLLARARAEGDEPDKPIDCRENVPVFDTIKIENVNVQPEGFNFFIFSVPYKNNTCIAQDVAIFMQVTGKNDKVVQLVSHELFLGPGETKHFEWRLIILNRDRDPGRNKIEFFVWRSSAIPIPLSNKKTIFI